MTDRRFRINGIDMEIFFRPSSSTGLQYPAFDFTFSDLNTFQPYFRLPVAMQSIELP